MVTTDGGKDVMPHLGLRWVEIEDGLIPKSLSLNRIHIVHVLCGYAIKNI